MSNGLLKRSVSNIFKQNIRFQQHWEWRVDFSGLSDVLPNFDVFAKSISYGSGTIEYDHKKIGGVTLTIPTHQTAGTITMTIRDDNKGTVERWMKDRLSNVIDDKGNISLKPQSTFYLDLYRIVQNNAVDYEEVLANRWLVSPAKMGDFNREKDNLTEFVTFTIEFQKHKSPANPVDTSSSFSNVTVETVANKGKSILGRLF